MMFVTRFDGHDKSDLWDTATMALIIFAFDESYKTAFEHSVFAKDEIGSAHSILPGDNQIMTCVCISFLV